jgi:hypothetical protein
MEVELGRTRLFNTAKAVFGVTADVEVEMTEKCLPLLQSLQAIAPDVDLEVLTTAGSRPDRRAKVGSKGVAGALLLLLSPSLPSHTLPSPLQLVFAA